MKGRAGKIPPEILSNTRRKLDEIIFVLEPYFAKFTTLNRGSPFKMEDNSLKFLELAHEFAVEYPDFFPDFTEKEVFGEEFITIRELWALSAKLKHLSGRLCAAILAAGSHTLETAEAFFQTVKIAARHDIPGARAVYEELRPRFPSKRQKICRSVAAG